MGDKGGAYEHSSGTTGFGQGEKPPRTSEHAEATIPASTDRNEINVRERNQNLPDPDEVRQPGRTHPHGPETHQDTRFTRKSGE
ncbi:MAG TPA: hypothetical protein VHG28_03690 [Longimicrobiaceae bacterium]|nr:hypothetical protein [Longimicrobiaceae bacterium]